MKIAVTRPSPLGFVAAKPQVVDTADLTPEDGARLKALVAAARRESAAARTSGDTARLAVRIDIEGDDDGPVSLHQAEGHLTPAAADLVDAVSRLRRR